MIDNDKLVQILTLKVLVLLLIAKGTEFEDAFTLIYSEYDVRIIVIFATYN